MEEFVPSGTAGLQACLTFDACRRAGYIRIKLGVSRLRVDVFKIPSGVYSILFGIWGPKRRFMEVGTVVDFLMELPWLHTWCSGAGLPSHAKPI